MADVSDDKDAKGSPTMEKRDSGEQGVTILDSQPPVAQARTLRRDLNSRQISMIAIGGVHRRSYEGADGSGDRHRPHHRCDQCPAPPADLCRLGHRPGSRWTARHAAGVLDHGRRLVRRKSRWHCSRRGYLVMCALGEMATHSESDESLPPLIRASPAPQGFLRLREPLRRSRASPHQSRMTLIDRLSASRPAVSLCSLWAC